LATPNLSYVGTVSLVWFDLYLQLRATMKVYVSNVTGVSSLGTSDLQQIYRVIKLF